MRTPLHILTQLPRRSLLFRSALFVGLILLAVTFKGCYKTESTNESYFTVAKAKYYFEKIEATCFRESDEEQLWGRNIYGPLMFVDRDQRVVYANFPDREGNLKKKEGIYTSTYPRDLIINRDSLTFGGTKFALAALPPVEDEFTIMSRGIRSLYYYHQRFFGYKPLTYNTANMDERNARLWIKLEWRALKKAIQSDGNERTVALRDALIFRGSNHELYSRYMNDEIIYENFEGLAMFTYLLYATSSEQELVDRLLQSLDETYTYSSYARTYGSIHGALYAWLAYEKGFDFTTIKSADTDLGAIVRELYKISLPEFCRDVAGSIALNYDLSTVQAEEDARNLEITNQIKRQTNLFTEKPVVSIDLISPYFDYEPLDIVPVVSLGTIYNKLNVSDNWGKLMVDKGGCLVSGNFRNLKLPAGNIKIDRTHIYGEGWNLTLNSDWEVVQNGDNYIVRRVGF